LAEYEATSRTALDSFDLHIAFLHDVEQRHLDLAGQIRQLIHRKDAAIRARQQS